MRRSWVLADGERKRLTTLKSSSKLPEVTGQPAFPPTPETAGPLLTMDKEESDRIQVSTL
jgi:hypothetical protein